ncbi:MAG: glycoside hydrolase [Thermoflexales bacterium]|nr:glycoside hydrolase [Thermoflexales bacterium]
MRLMHLTLQAALLTWLAATTAGAQWIENPPALPPLDPPPHLAPTPLQDAFAPSDRESISQPNAAAPLLFQPHNALQAFVAAQWTPLEPIDIDLRPSLQSAPVVAALTSGDAFVAWMDSRNALPDVYGTRWSQGPAGETRVAHRHPHFAVSGLRHVAVAGEHNRVFVAWADEAQIYLARGDLDSSAWTSPTVVVTSTQWEHIAIQPKLAADGNGDILVVWIDFRESSGRARLGDIYARRCNGNATPVVCSGPAVRINDDASAAHAQRAPAVSRQGNRVVVVWEDGREAGAHHPRIYASFSSDGGQSWSANMRVNKRLDGSPPDRRDAATNPAVAFDANGSVWVAWENRIGAPSAPPDVYVARWDGSAWSAPWRVDAAPPRTRSVAPTIAAQGGTVFVAWQDHRDGHANTDIYSAIWSGSSWTEYPATTALGAQRVPSLSAAGGQVYLVWEDTNGGQADVYGSRWEGNGWATPVRLNTPATRLPYQISPALASVNGQTYALFVDRREMHAQLYLARKGLYGGWQRVGELPTGAMNDTQVAYERANLVADAQGRLHALWLDGRWPRGWRVRHSAFNGTTWTDPVFVSRQITSNEGLPSLAVHGDTLAAAWSRWTITSSSTPPHVQLYASWSVGGSAWVTESAVLTQPFAAWVWPTSVATDGDFVYVVWHRNEPQGRGHILLARKAMQVDAPWSYAQINPPHSDDWCYHVNPRIASDQNGALHVVWVGCARRNPSYSWPRDYYLYYAASSNRGDLWSVPLRVHLVSQDYFFDAHPALTVARDGSVMAVYQTRSGNARGFAAALIRNGNVVFTHTLASDTAWAPSGVYQDRYYGGDGAGSVSYDALTGHFTVAMVERMNGRAPRIATTRYLNPNFFPRAFLPFVMQ